MHYDTDDTLLLMLRLQYVKIKNDLLHRTMVGRTVNAHEWRFLTDTREMIYDAMGLTHVQVNANPSIDPETGLAIGDPYAQAAWWDTAHGGSGKKPRKIRKRQLKRDEPKERWIIHGAEDELCLRYENTVWPVNAGPIPETDTHPNCKCERISYRARKSDTFSLK